MVLEDVFNWALPLLHNPAVHNAVCSLITTILSTVDESSALRKKYTFEVVVNNISRLHIFHQELCNLSNS
uniref:Uncharacterized protein n=1 Tax=Ditylenchus dipsaci TaxID=166011 RepID=A0A915CXP9_9BILA